MFCKKGRPKSLSNKHRKAPVLESLFNKKASLQGCSFIKKRLQDRCFPVNIANFLRTAISRSSHRRCSVKKGVLRNFAKFIGKHLCQRTSERLLLYSENIQERLLLYLTDISEQLVFREAIFQNS